MLLYGEWVEENVFAPVAHRQYVFTGTVIYRSKMHAGLKRNFQVTPGTEWLVLLCKHIPDRYEHLVRYVEWYSNRARGERGKKASPPAGVALPSPGEEPATEFAARASPDLPCGKKTPSKHSGCRKALAVLWCLE